MLPSDWSLTTLGQVCNGQLQTGPFGSQLRASEYTDEGVPVIMPTNLADGTIDADSAARIPMLRAIELKRHWLEPGDIVFSRRGDVSRAALVTEAEAGFICGTGCLRARPVSQLIDSRFLSYFIQTPFAATWLASNAVGQTMPNLNTTILSELPIRLPPLKEQSRIAALISMWDEAVDCLNQMIALKRERKRGLMQVLLTGKKRFKEYNSIPWKKVSLSQVGRVASGGTPSTSVPDYWNGEHAWCTPSEVTALGSRFIESTTRHITEEGLRASAAELLPTGSLIVCTRATIGDCAINAVPMAMNQGFKAIVPGDDVDVEFLYYKIVNEKPALLRLANGSTFLEVSKRDFEGLVIEVPCLEEQRKIATVLSTADSEIEKLEKQLAAYKLQKRGLMQQLLTGKKRAKAQDSEAVPA